MKDGLRARVRKLNGGWWAFMWRDGFPAPGVHGPFASAAEAGDRARLAHS